MRYELSDKEWSIIRPMLPTKPRGVPRVDDRRVLNGIFWVLRSGAPRAGPSRHLWSPQHLLQSLRSLAGSRYLGWHHAGDDSCAGCGRADDRHVNGARPSGNQAVGRSRGGLTRPLATRL